MSVERKRKCMDDFLIVMFAKNSPMNENDLKTIVRNALFAHTVYGEQI